MMNMLRERSEMPIKQKNYMHRERLHIRSQQRITVGNSPTYDLMVSPYLVKNLDTIKLAGALEPNYQ